MNVTVLSPFILRSVPAGSVVALALVCAGGCSDAGSSSNEEGTSANGAVTATGTVAGTASGAGGSSATTGGAASSIGGATTAVGGASTSSNGNVGAGGLPTSGASTTGGGADTTGGGAGFGGAGFGGATSGAGGASTGAATGGSSGMGGVGGGGAGTGGGASDRSPGCGTAVDRPDPKVQLTMDIDGTTRYYLLDVPSSADNQTPLSLVFALHGYDMNNVSVVGLFNFTERSNGQAITVYPQGEGPPPGNTSHWGDGVLESTWTANEQNYAFIESLITELGNRFCIDPSRIFIAGFSMGGMFTNSIACAHNDWFRGFAPVEGLGPGSCADAGAQPAIIIHQGTKDTLVGPDQGEGSRDFWIGQNGCNQTTTSSFTGCETYDGCSDGKPVVYCVGDWDHTITATATANIWSFFEDLD